MYSFIYGFQFQCQFSFGLLITYVYQDLLKSNMKYVNKCFFPDQSERKILAHFLSWQLSWVQSPGEVVQIFSLWNLTIFIMSVWVSLGSSCFKNMQTSLLETLKYLHLSKIIMFITVVLQNNMVVQMSNTVAQ